MSTNTPNHTGLRIRDFARLPSSSPHEDRTIKQEPKQEPVWDENSNPLENIPSSGLELLKFKDYLPSSPQIGSIWPCSTFSGSSDRLEDWHRYRQTFEQLVDLRSEYENLKRKNKMTEELRDKAENERDELQLQNDILKNKLMSNEDQKMLTYIR